MSDAGEGEDSLQRSRATLAARLRARQGEVEEAIFARIGTVPGREVGGGDPEVVEEVRAVVHAAVEHALGLLEAGEDPQLHIPEVATASAQRVARYGITLETLLRRYMAAHQVLTEFAMAEAGDMPEEELSRLLRDQGSWLDRFLAAVADAHTRETELLGRSPSQRLAERVQALLDGEPIGAAELQYELDDWHLGVIARGPDAEQAVRTLAGALSRRLLEVPREEGLVWAWLGGREPAAMQEIERRHEALLPEGVSLALGEPRQGGDGWRLTHHEARAAAQVLSRRPSRLARARHTLLLAAMLREEHLARGLLKTYLEPLGDGREGQGAIFRATLRAYLDANCNAAAAATVLEINRHTVKHRLARIEELLGVFVHECRPELEIALQLEELDRPA